MISQHLRTLFLQTSKELFSNKDRTIVEPFALLLHSLSVPSSNSQKQRLPPRSITLFCGTFSYTICGHVIRANIVFCSIHSDDTAKVHRNNGVSEEPSNRRHCKDLHCLFRYRRRAFRCVDRLPSLCPGIICGRRPQHKMVRLLFFTSHHVEARQKKGL